MGKTLKNIIIAGILLIVISVAFYFLYYLPNKERKLETARKECWSKYKSTSAEYFPDKFKMCMSEKGLAD